MNNALILNPSFINISFRWKISLKLFWLLSFLSIVALLVFYIFQVNAAVSERYLIQEYEKRIGEVSRESQNLVISSAQVGSLDKVEELLETLNFEKINKIHYIRVLDTQVARQGSN